MIYHALRPGALLLRHTGADLTLTAHSMYMMHKAQQCIQPND